MNVMLKEVILSMPYVWEATAYEPGQEARYSAHFIIERNSAAHRQIQAALLAEAEKLWGPAAPGKLKAVTAAGRVWCLREGDTKVSKDGTVLAGYQDKLYVSAKNTTRPLLLNPDRTPTTREEDRMYPGAIVNALVDVRAASQPNDQIFARLKGIQFVRDGVRLGSGTPATAEDFEEIKPLNAAEATF